MAQLISFYTHVHMTGIPRKTHLKSNLCVRYRAVFPPMYGGSGGICFLAN